MDRDLGCLVELKGQQGKSQFSERLLEVSKLTLGCNLVLLAPLAAYNEFHESMGGSLVLCWRLLHTGDFFCKMPSFRSSYYLQRLLILRKNARPPCRKPFECNDQTCLDGASCLHFGLVGIPIATILGYATFDLWNCPRILGRDSNLDHRLLLSGIAVSSTLGLIWFAFSWIVARRTLLTFGWLDRFGG